MTDIEKQVEEIGAEVSNLARKIYSFAYRYGDGILISFNLVHDYELPKNPSYEDMRERSRAINEGRVNKKLEPVFTVLNRHEDSISMDYKLVNKTNELIQELNETVEEYNIKYRKMIFLQKALYNLKDAESAEKDAWIFDF